MMNLEVADPDGVRSVVGALDRLTALGVGVRVQAHSGEDLVVDLEV